METAVTFFAWADTHFGYEQEFGDADLRLGIIEQMNALPGWPYPDEIGGVVAAPDFVVSCGDQLDGQGGAGETEMAYFRYHIERLRYPHHEVMGNHDCDPVSRQAFEAEYGGLSYSFDCRGAHFIALNSVYDEQEVGHVEPPDLDFLAADLRERDGNVPAVLFVHNRLDRLTNGNAVLAILSGSPVKLVVSAHEHRPAVFQLEGIDCVTTGHCRNHPIDAPLGRCFYVIHLTADRTTAVPWRWDLRDWERGRGWSDPAAAAHRFRLDRTIRHGIT